MKKLKPWDDPVIQAVRVVLKARRAYAKVCTPDGRSPNFDIPTAMRDARAGACMRAERDLLELVIQENRKAAS